MRRIFANRLIIYLLGVLTGTVMLVMYSIYQGEPIHLFHEKTEFSEQNVDKGFRVHEAPAKASKSKTSLRKASNSDSKTDSLNISVADSTLTAHLDSFKSQLDSIDNINLNKIDIDSVSDNIVLVQDILIHSQKYKPTGNPVVFHCEDPNELDSLLVENIVESTSDGILVEFWKSPVNFKGYLLSRRKLILFGIFDYNELKFSYHDDSELIMSFKGKDFVLRCGNDFTPLNFNTPRKTK